MELDRNHLHKPVYLVKTLPMHSTLEVHAFVQLFTMGADCTTLSPIIFKSVTEF